MDAVVKYIDGLLEKSTPDAPVWNIEKIKQVKSEPVYPRREAPYPFPPNDIFRRWRNRCALHEDGKGYLSYFY